MSASTPVAPGRRIVVVSYYFPPAPSSGAQRWASMARHLRAMGHSVTVVTSAIHGPPPSAAEHVRRTRDLAGAAVLRRALRRPEIGTPGTTEAQTPAPALLTHVVPPDSHLVSWAPWAVAAVRRLARSAPIDCLVTTSPPDSVHLAGLLLGRRRPPWIADFRDGWRFEPMRGPWPTGAQDRLDAWLERRVARSADVVTGATLPIAEDLRTRLGANAHCVTNGFEPDIAGPRPPAGAGGDPRILVHTGTMSGGWGRDPRPLLAALAKLDGDRRPGEPRVRLVVAGRLSREDEKAIADAGLGDAVQTLGLLSRDEALALQRRADALLLLTGRHRSEATGKLFEYLASGRPIIALARDNEAERIVRETHTGVTVDGGDPTAIRAVLQALVDGTLARSYAPRGLDRFRYPGPAEAIAELVELARARR